ncbi:MULTISPECIES: C40 family peptidase [Halomonas]|uniref:NlpC/P60 family protein n=2 Tax=Halomonas TaxID=2745 RepID=A0A7X4VYB6_9GAMM|nr:MULTISPECIES: C40 family peptidase [Halomonas]MDR5902597.1 C40 family peptidase [Halomonas icarae]NAW12456.1 NlpC/P60 family protein [Halomonas icarae]TDB04683.1 NlpC/P60 family protein [Halomonas marinisediminis]
MPPALSAHLPPISTRLVVLLMTLMLLTGCAGKQLAVEDPPPGEGLSIDRVLILAAAERTLGTPYRFGGNSPTGVDCSGLVQLAYQAAGLAVPRTADDQFRRLPKVDRARPGDLLFFDTSGGGKASHVGIYRGNGQMIHAPGRGRRVETSPVEIAYWQERFLGAAALAP